MIALLDQYAALEVACRGYQERAERAEGRLFDAGYHEGELHAENAALAATVERVREWLMSRGVDVSDRDDDYVTGYRDAQRHAVMDAAALLAIIDGAADAEASDDGCPVCDWRDHHYHRTNHFTGTTVQWRCDGRFRDCDDEGPTDDGQFTFTRCYIPSTEDDRDEARR